MAPFFRFPLFSCLIIAAALGACGVRGRPQPPLTPAELGRGKPTFKRSTEAYAFPNVPNPESNPEPNPSSKARKTSPRDGGN